MGWAVLLPVFLVLAGGLYLVYQASASQTYQMLEQVSRRYAAEFEVSLSRKFGEVEALAALIPSLGEAKTIALVSETDPELVEAWVRRDDAAPAQEAPERVTLYNRVRERGTEVLSDADYVHRRASLGVPLVVDGKFIGMLGATFSLDSFQKSIESVRVLRSGYTFLVDHSGLRIAHPQKDLIGTRIGNDVDQAQARQMLANVDRGVAFSFEKRALVTGQWSRQFYAPITVGRAWNPWFLVSVVPLSEANEGTNLLFALLIGGVLLTLLLTAGATARAASRLVRPLQEVAATAEQVAAGQFDARVTWEGEDEVGLLARSFNRMTERLVDTLRDQETLVRDRTASLTRSLADLEQAQAKLVDTEKMAVLGQLTATIAHEINTPLGAIRSSATYLHQTVSLRFGDLPEFFRSMGPADLAFYKALVIQKGVVLQPAATGEDRKRRRALAQRLRDTGEEDPDGLAEDIVFLVPEEEDEALLEAVAAGRRGLIQKAAETAQQLQSSSIILEASDRAAGTVAALVDYSRARDIRSEDEVDPAKELDTLMTLYYGVAKRGVEVVRQFEPGVTLQGDRDKLNQVWVNLINNALHAMEKQGHLHLRTRSVGHAVEVSILNDGPPVPVELREKIFEPFFTTKKTGEGTGLGLDICRRIVEAHHGSLTLCEEGPLTCFTVRLPAHPEPRSTP